MSIDDATPDEWYSAHMATLNNKAELTARDIEGINAALARVPFGELPLMTRAYVFLLHQTGKVEMKSGNVRIETPAWTPNATYQVCAIKKPQTKPSIDWSQIKPEYKWLARDANGRAFAFVACNRRSNANWYGDETARVDNLTSYAPGDCDWKDSLVKRPAGV